jgi:hypothetical protein
MHFPTDPAALILYLIDLGITLTEQNKERIRADHEAAQAESDAAVDRNRKLDAPREDS